MASVPHLDLAPASALALSASTVTTNEGNMSEVTETCTWFVRDHDERKP